GRLVQLEIENFKSYKGRQIIGPFDNFTSVIGPNGAGKSNLMDAISFVLGIQSAHLRSTKLKDLIYRNEKAVASDENESSAKGKASGSGKRGGAKGKKRARQDEESENEDDEEDNEEFPKTASVTAVYLKSEDDEVRFSRIITPAGSSEYRINGTVVTAPKYNSALEAENILIKARNFLVFQGDVEAVASQSPRDLTKLIEQISGSLELKPEYERLKALQDRATENSTFNFNKKRGITAEVKQIKEQKEEAERFEKLLRQKSKLVVNHLLWKLYHFEKNVSEIEASIAEDKEAGAEITAEQQQMEEAVKDAKKAMAQMTKKAMKLQREIKERKGAVDEQKPDLLRVEEKIKHATKKINQANSNLTKAKADYERQMESINSLEKTLDEVTKAAEKYEAQLKKKATKSKMPVFDEDLQAEYNSHKETVAGQTVKERQQVATLQRELKTKSEDRLRKEEALNVATNREKQLLEDQASLTERQSKLSEEVAQFKADVEKAKKELEGIESQRRKLRQQESQKNEQLAEVQGKLLQARADRNESEKEAKNRETLESLKRIYPGVYGRLTDLCKPTQRKYDVAVSTILGRNMDAILVDNEKTGIECIQYLREQRCGTATFLPLETLTVKPINEKYRNFVRGARLAVDVIQVDPRYERAVQFACGSALVCETLDVAKEVCWNKGQEVKAVTLDGTVLHKTGLMTGGTSSSSNSNARRWEEKEIEALRKARDTLMADLGEIAKTRRRLTSDEQLRADISSAESRLTVAADCLSTTKRTLASVQKELQHIRSEIDDIRPRLEAMVAEIEDKQAECSSLEAIIHQVEDQVFKSFCRKMGVADIREFEEGQGAARQEAEQKRLEFETNKAKYSNQITFERNQSNEAQARIERLEASLEEDQANLTAFNEEREGYTVTIDKYTAEIEEYQTLLDECNEELETRKGSVETARQQLATVTKQAESQAKAIAGKEAQIDKINAEKWAIFRKCKLEEIKIPLHDGSLEDISLDAIDRAMQNEDSMDVDEGDGSESQTSYKAMLENLQVDYSGLKKEHKQNGNYEVDAEFQESIKNISSDIEKMAPNMRAQEKFDDVEAKLRATTDEFENARKEAKAAKDAFNAIKQKRYKLFHTAFTHISEKIDVIYKQLTKSKTFPLGGTAYLSLEDSDEPYLDGVKFHAMPPMKRFRDMEQLSGGEKTVAALSLLFAIHSFRPAPFFVLDEVDAALDNANVAKVAAYIRSLSTNNNKNGEEDNLQFIVISLKSTFYEKAEALVGIYKDQEVNSSRVLTLSLKEMEE
ncbi:Structural maintenance of chromosomes protein 1, partial [Chytridiales sp. JEL 0842]